MTAKWRKRNAAHQCRTLRRQIERRSNAARRKVPNIKRARTVQREQSGWVIYCSSPQSNSIVVLRIYGISIFVECVWLSSNQWFSLTSRPVKNVKKHRAIEPRVTSYPTYHALRCFLHCWCVLCSRYMRALPSIVWQEREFKTLKLTLDAVAPCLESL